MKHGIAKKPDYLIWRMAKKTIFKCKGCSILFTPKERRKRYVYCSANCYHFSSRGKIAHNKGIFHTEESRKKMSASRKGKCVGANNHRWISDRELVKIRYGMRYVIGNFTHTHRRHWLDDHCSICGSKDDLQLDHIIPIIAGGKTIRENAQTLCRKHNLIKRKSDLEMANKRCELLGSPIGIISSQVRQECLERFNDYRIPSRTDDEATRAHRAS